MYRRFALHYFGLFCIASHCFGLHCITGALHWIALYCFGLGFLDFNVAWRFSSGLALRSPQPLAVRLVSRCNLMAVRARRLSSSLAARDSNFALAFLSALSVTLCFWRSSTARVAARVIACIAYLRWFCNPTSTTRWFWNVTCRKQT
jgi:hypothetical protein